MQAPLWRQVHKAGPPQHGRSWRDPGPSSPSTPAPGTCRSRRSLASQLRVYSARMSAMLSLSLRAFSYLRAGVHGVGAWACLLGTVFCCGAEQHPSDW